MPLRRPLRPFQRADVEAALAGGARWYNMNPMGLGKSATGLGVAEAIADRDGACQTLIITKASLRENWAREVVKWTGRIPTMQRADGAYGPAGAMYHVASYETVVARQRELQRLRPDLIVLDEAHKLRNPRTQVATATLALRSPYAYALSATPVLNGPREFYPVAHYLRPDLFPSARAFALEFGGWIPNDLPRNLAWLHHTARTIATRRRIEDVAPEMPAINPITEWITLSSAAQRAYETALARIELEEGQRPSATQVIPLLRAMEADKLAAAWELIDELVADGRRVLLFSQFVDPVARTARRYASRAFSITGKVPATERQRLVDQMERGDVQIGAITLGVGAEGLNIPSADTVIHLDLAWVPDLHAQATARARRLTSTHAFINEYTILAARTVDEHLADLQAEKRGVTRTIAEGA